MSNESLFQPGDTWPVGSVGVEDISGLFDLLEDGFDVLGWPELVGYDRNEHLSDFWMLAYVEWFETDGNKDLDDALVSRPGVRGAINRYKGKKLKVFKGQTMGPATLVKALRAYEYPIVDREAVVEFICQSVEAQNTIFSTISDNVIVSLDEPSAFLEMGSMNLWESTFEKMPDDYLVALHSCGTPKVEWVDEKWSVIHLDAREIAMQMGDKENLEVKLNWDKYLSSYTENGGWLALGVIPSNPLPINRDDVRDDVEEILGFLPPEVLKKSLISTSCGIGVRTKEELESRLGLLRYAQELFKEKIRK